jgi:hypothetical protein
MINIFKKQKGTGAVLDNRPLEEKEKDYKFEELVSSADPVNWVEKNTWKTYPIYDQNGSGSCVAQTVAKMLGIMYQNMNNEYVHFSATHVYTRRSNKPQGGMIGTNAGDIARQGVTLEALVPSQSMTDAQMDAIQIPEYKNKVGEIFKIENYVSMPIRDIDTIASTIQKTGKPVMVWFYFNHDEWTTEPTVKRNVDLYAPNTSRHSVTAVDFLLKNGKKYLVIDDSWGTSYGQKGQRLISEDFFRQRNFFAMYFLDFKFEEGDIQEESKPKYTFTQTLRFNPTVTYNNPEVVALQKCLQFLGHFPANSQCTGYFGSVTRASVIKFQKQYNLSADGIVGPQSRAKLNELFS